MLYACSVLFKSKLPMVLAFNKTDACSADTCLEWMADFETYQDAVRGASGGGGDGPSSGRGEGYMGSLNSSLSLVLDEFYRNIRRIGVSAATGEGIEGLFEKFDEAAVEFREVYLPDLERRRVEQVKQEAIRQKAHMDRLKKDLEKTKGDKEVV